MMQGALAQHIRPLLQSCNTAGILPAVVARDFEFDHNMAAAARKERKKHNASRPPNFDRISKKYRDFDPIAVAVLSDDPTREPDTSRVGSEDLACHDRWLSGWIRASFPGNLCFVHERQHDEYRPEQWAGRFSRRLSIRSCHRVLRHRQFFGKSIVSVQIASFPPNRVWFDCRPSCDRCWLRMEWSAEYLFPNRVALLGHGHDQSSFI